MSPFSYVTLAVSNSMLPASIKYRNSSNLGGPVLNHCEAADADTAVVTCYKPVKAHS